MLASPGWRGRVSQRGAIAALTVGTISGGLLSSVTLAALGGLVAPIPAALRGAAVACIALTAGLRDLGLCTVALPENRRIIPHDLFRSHPWRAAAQFGFELGTGLRTYVSSSAPYVLAAALLLLAPSVQAAAVAGAAFGLGRAAMVWMRFAAPDATRWDDRLTRVCALPGVFGPPPRLVARSGSSFGIRLHLHSVSRRCSSLAYRPVCVAPRALRDGRSRSLGAQRTSSTDH